MQMMRSFTPRARAQAGQEIEAVRQRLKECRLELHPEKTKIVYCQDDDRKQPA